MTFKNDECSASLLVISIVADGNDGNVFYLNSSDNAVEIRVNGEIDRETVSEYVLTVKCFKRKTKVHSLHKKYNKQDPSERQVVVKVLDVDDNLPRFVDEIATLGKSDRRAACGWILTGRDQEVNRQ